MKIDSAIFEKSPAKLRAIAEKVTSGKRISAEEGLALYKEGELGFLGMLANYVREKKNGDYVFFNRNMHIEPTNLCVFDCKFCSYSRLLKQKSDADAWEMTAEQMLAAVKNNDQNITEVHIVGGVHPKMDLHYFANLLKEIKSFRPDLQLKAFTAVELEYMFRKAKVSYKEGLKLLQEHGLDSIPGGGAEIFDHEIRKQICEDKCTAEQWLEIHETAHGLGIHSNATMLYGHIESYDHRIDHMVMFTKGQKDRMMAAFYYFRRGLLTSATTTDLCSTGGNGTNELSLGQLIDVYPNPSTGSVFLYSSIPNITSADVILYNTVGEAVFTKKMAIPSGKDVGLNINNLSDGIYFIKILTPEGTLTKKVVLNR